MTIQGWISMTKTRKLLAFLRPKKKEKKNEQPDETEVVQMCVTEKEHKKHFSSLLVHPTYQN